MLLNKQWLTKLGFIALLAGYGSSIVYASCIESLCRARGAGYDCMADGNAPEWVCQSAKAPPAPAPCPACPAAASAHESKKHSPALKNSSPEPIPAPAG